MVRPINLVLELLTVPQSLAEGMIDNQHVEDRTSKMYLTTLVFTNLVYLVNAYCLTDTKVDRMKDTRFTSACMIMTLHLSPS